MLKTEPFTVRDLQPLGVTRQLVVASSAKYPSALAVISLSCIFTLALLGAGAAWLGLQKDWISLADFHRSTHAAVPAVFPTWIEVPHLTELIARNENPNALIYGEKRRSFLDHNAADIQTGLAFLPPRINPQQPLFASIQFDAARFFDDQIITRDGTTKTLPPQPLTPVRSAEVETLTPSELLRADGRTEASQTNNVPLASVITPASPEMASSSEEVSRPTRQTATSSPPGLVATIIPDTVHPTTERTISTTLQTDVIPGVPTLNPKPTKRVRSLRRPQSVVVNSPSPDSFRDTEETASIARTSRHIRTRIDVGGVAHGLSHRLGRGEVTVPSPVPASSPQWTMPSVLAPTQ